MNNIDKSSGARAWQALVLCFIATVVAFIPYVGYSTQTSKIMAELGLNYTQVGWIASAGALVGGIVLPFAGFIMDRWSARNITIVGLVLACLGQFWFASAESYNTLLYARLLQGVGIPLLFLGPYTLALRWAEGSQRSGVFMGTMLACDGVGTLVAVYAFGYVLISTGWRTGMQVGGVLIVVLILLLFAKLREPAPFKSSRSNDGEYKIRTDSLEEYVRIATNRNVLVSSAFLTGVFGSYSLAVYWVPTLLMEEGGWSEGGASFIGALYPVAGIISAVLFGLISDRLGHRKLLMLISGLGMAISFLAAAYALSLRAYGVMAGILPIMGLFAYGGLPIAYCLTADTVGVRNAATANGIVMAVGFTAGGVVYPSLMGAIKDASGHYVWGFAAAAVSVLVLNVILVFFVRDGKSTVHSGDAKAIKLA